MKRKEYKTLRKWRIAPAVLSLALLLFMTVGGTLAFLMMETGPITNVFTPKLTTITVEEKFEKDVKSMVAIKNISEVPVYIRASLIPMWEDEEGNPVGESASLEDNLNIVWSSNGKWAQGPDQFWYYKDKVAAGASTENLIEQATVKTENEYHMNLQIQAQCIQADGVDEDGRHPVVLAWESGVKAVDADGTLQIKEKEEAAE